MDRSADIYKLVQHVAKLSGALHTKTQKKLDTHVEMLGIDVIGAISSKNAWLSGTSAAETAGDQGYQQCGEDKFAWRA